MKISANVLLLAGVLAAPGLTVAQDLGGLGGSPDESHGDPFTPVGSLTVTPTVVQPGVQPDMTWSIEYPKAIPDLAIIVPPGKLLTTNEKTEKLCIRVAGVSFASQGTNLPTALWIRINGGGWRLVFYGTENDVNPSEILFEETIHSGTHVDFAARGKSSYGTWYTPRWTLSDTPNVAALTRGDALPSESPAFTDGSIEGFMTQFVSNSNQIIASPRDIVYLFELGSDTPGDSFFDMQDLVMVVSFCKNNNGHGNNEDGFDSSNPGDSSGVGGVEDSIIGYEDDGTPIYGSSGFIDDEKAKIRKK